jgi:hypothetical protein
MSLPISKQHNSAILLARKGYRVFPCLPSNKVPAVPHGCKAATRGKETIDAWWLADPDFNIGVATGKASGFFVIDIDSDEGEAALKEMEGELGALPPTVEVITATGRHLWFKTTEATIRNSVKQLAPGIDVRGDGGYVLAPPSVHPSGHVYCWSVDCADAVAQAPDWLLARVTSKKNGNGKIEATPTAEWLKLVSEGVDEGERDCTATKLAGYLMHHRVQVDVADALLRLWNEHRCRPPLPGEDIDRIIESIAGRELEKRTGRRVG